MTKLKRVPFTPFECTCKDDPFCEHLENPDANMHQVPLFTSSNGKSISNVVSESQVIPPTLGLSKHDKFALASHFNSSERLQNAAERSSELVEQLAKSNQKGSQDFHRF